MGRIKTQLLKRFTRKIYAAHAAELKDNFEENKKIVSAFADISSKKHRNSIAGYLTRMKKRGSEE